MIRSVMLSLLGVLFSSSDGSHCKKLLTMFQCKDKTVFGAAYTGCRMHGYSQKTLLQDGLMENGRCFFIRQEQSVKEAGKKGEKERGEGGENREKKKRKKIQAWSSDSLMREEEDERKSGERRKCCLFIEPCIRRGF